MKKALWMSVLVLILGPIWLACDDDHAVNSSNEYTAEEPFSYTVEVQDQTRFRLLGITGTIEMTGHPGTETITISGHKRVGASSTAEAQAHLGDIRIDVQDSEDEVLVRTIHQVDAEGRNYQVDYTITLPPDLEVRVSNQTGTVTVEQMEEDVRADVITGGVVLEEVDGDVRIDVITGSVILDQLTGSADVDLATGTLVCRAFLPPEGVLDLKTITGSLSVQIPESTSAELTASVTSGQISISNLPLQNPTVSNTYVSGQLGDGDGTITLQVITGSMTIAGFSD